jgi:HK97 family phage major capsid protein
MNLEALQARLLELTNANDELLAKVSAEKRDLTVEEDSQMNERLDEMDRVNARIIQLQRQQATRDQLSNPNGRKTSPAPVAQLAGDGEGDVNIVRPQPQRLSVPASPIRPIDKNGGFHTLGHFAQSVRGAALRGGNIDPRLERLASASTYGSESSGADGGWAIPPDFRASIMEKVLGEDTLISRCDQVTVQGNSITVPTDETTPWQTSGGIQAYWEGEAQATTQSKPKLADTTVKLNKLKALVPMTEELLEDAPAMDAYLRRKAPDKISFKLDLALVQGNGVGQPLGMRDSPATVSIAKESSQTADTLIAMNVIKMYTAMPARNRQNAVWLINPDIEPMLHTLSLPGRDGVGNFVTGWGSHIYMPANGLSQSPFGTLFGRPVIPHQACETLGDKGDILFVDPTQYLALLKSGPNPRVDVSMHLWFDQDLIAYKFTLRVGGQPWWKSAMSARDGSATYSPFVTLDERG